MRPAIVFVFLLWGGGEKLLLCEGGQDVARGSAVLEVARAIIYYGQTVSMMSSAWTHPSHRHQATSAFVYKSQPVINIQTFHSRKRRVSKIIGIGKR